MITGDGEQNESRDKDPETSTERWARSVRFSQSGGGFAYRVGELIIDRAARDELLDMSGLDDVATFDIGPSLQLIAGLPGELGIAEALRSRGRRAQANHVVFAAADMHANPAMNANPAMHATPPCGQPECTPTRRCTPTRPCTPTRRCTPTPPCTPTRRCTPTLAVAVVAAAGADAGNRSACAGAAGAHRLRRRSAGASAGEPPLHSNVKRTRKHPELLRPATGTVGGSCSVVVLDTGLAPVNLGGNIPHVSMRAAEPWGPTKYDKAVTTDPHYDATDNIDLPDMDHNDWLDPVAGHGTFIAGLVSRLAPNAEVTLGRGPGELG